MCWIIGFVKTVISFENLFESEFFDCCLWIDGCLEAVVDGGFLGFFLPLHMEWLEFGLCFGSRCLLIV